MKFPSQSWRNSSYILPSTDVNFQEWWKELGDDEDVEVRYPHEQHGLKGKTSNRAKTDVKNDFLKFVDNNSTQMVVRQIADAQHTTFYPNFAE